MAVDTFAPECEECVLFATIDWNDVGVLDVLLNGDGLWKAILSGVVLIAGDGVPLTLPRFVDVIFFHVTGAVEALCVSWKLNGVFGVDAVEENEETGWDPMFAILVNLGVSEEGVLETFGRRTRSIRESFWSGSLSLFLIEDEDSVMAALSTLS